MAALSRRARLLIVFAGLGTALALAVVSFVFPAKETSIGYVAEYTSSVGAVWEGAKLSEATWAKVREQCPPQEHRMEPYYGSPYTHEVFCRTKADRQARLFKYVAAVLLFPVLALLIGWVLGGSPSRDR